MNAIAVSTALAAAVLQLVVRPARAQPDKDLSSLPDGWVTTPTPTTWCPDGFAGVNCHACEEDTYSRGCTAQCNSSTTCAGNGRCRGKDGTCICDEGWTGAGCSIPTSVTTPPPTTGWVTTPPPTTGWGTTPLPITVCPDGFGGVNCLVCEEDTYSGGCTALTGGTVIFSLSMKALM